MGATFAKNIKFRSKKSFRLWWVNLNSAINLIRYRYMHIFYILSTVRCDGGGGGVGFGESLR